MPVSLSVTEGPLSVQDRQFGLALQKVGFFPSQKSLLPFQKGSLLWGRFQHKNSSSKISPSQIPANSDSRAASLQSLSSSTARDGCLAFCKSESSADKPSSNYPVFALPWLQTGEPASYGSQGHLCFHLRHKAPPHVQRALPKLGSQERPFLLCEFPRSLKRSSCCFSLQLLMGREGRLKCNPKPADFPFSHVLQHGRKDRPRPHYPDSMWRPSGQTQQFGMLNTQVWALDEPA